MKSLEITWTISKARETYGWNRVTLHDHGKKYATCGGGYDMLGTVFADWLMSNYRDKIIQLTSHQDGGFYGLNRYSTGAWHLDGGCGLDCVKTIANAIGLDVQSIWNERKKTTTHFIVMEG